MAADLSVVELVIRASFLVQMVMLLLLAASVLSWFIIFHKRKVLADARKESRVFEDQFWSGINLTELFNRLKRKNTARHGMERIFESGFTEYARSHQKAVANNDVMLSSVQRGMKVALAREEDRLESNLSLLATIGSVSPYVGLFGTVWGIMNSFTALASVQHASLAMVAPGIAEALIATAMGLFAAIPAVIAYNRYAEHVNRLISSYENFTEEFATILQRQAHQGTESDRMQSESLAKDA